MQQGALFSGICLDSGETALLPKFLRGGEGLVPEGGELADAYHAAPFLIHPDEQGDGGRLLAVGHFLGYLLRRPVLNVPGEEQVAAQRVLGGVLWGIFLGPPGKEHLAYLFLQGHGVQVCLGQLAERGGLFLLGLLRAAEPPPPQRGPAPAVRRRGRRNR